MAEPKKVSTGSNFRKFFFRGLAIVLPSVLTIAILVWAYNFVQSSIAAPINQGVRWAILRTTSWPPLPKEVADLPAELNNAQRAYWRNDLKDEAIKSAWEQVGYSTIWLQLYKRQVKLGTWWSKYAFGLDLIGLIIAVVLIYTMGAFLGSLIGRRLYSRGEDLLAKVPLIRQVYPSVKQVTDFLFGGGEKRLHFNKVVAIEYPRKGLWSIGLVTGDTMRRIADNAGVPCVTVFVPSSPTPFTGYVVTVPQTETVDLPITIEQALRFTVSGGVIVPPSQVISASLDNESVTPEGAELLTSGSG